VDVYSFGMTMWVISQGTGEEPFQSSGTPNASIADQIQNGGLQTYMMSSSDGFELSF